MSTFDPSALEVWFVTGSQHLYGGDVLAQVAANAELIAAGLQRGGSIPARVVCKPVMASPEAIVTLCQEANASRACVGIVTWMHTFSPAKMWIAGLRALQKPLAHLHTQLEARLPWATIDMDFMNLHQSAHGDREFGALVSRMRKDRAVVVGHWKEEAVQRDLGVWARAAVAWHDLQGARVVRFGDNMREVAVTEGDKVEAQLRFGYSVTAHGVGDLAAYVSRVPDAERDALVREYADRYELAAAVRARGEAMRALGEQARIELGLRAFLREGSFKAFTTNFEDLHGLDQLPGLAVQRLMAEGYGFGAEGDWKTAALVRALKTMGAGLPGGTSFMEDYTYDFGGAGQVLGAHMLEVCASIAAGRPSLELHPLGIGGKADPARLVFGVAPGPAVNATVLDLGDRFRLLVNEVDVIAPPAPLPRLPVARAVWTPRPDLRTAAAAWILAGGAHHTAFSQAITTAHLERFAEIAGIELCVIDGATDLRAFRSTLRWNAAAY